MCHTRAAEETRWLRNPKSRAPPGKQRGTPRCAYHLLRLRTMLVSSSSRAKKNQHLFSCSSYRENSRAERCSDIGTTAPLFHMTREPFLLTERECWTCMGGVCGHKDAASHPNALHYSYSLTECSWLAAHCWLIDLQPCATGRVITLSKFLAKLRRGMRIENFPFAHMKVQTRSQTHQLRERLK